MQEVLGQCSHPPPPAPDPGGNETPDQSLPAPGNAFGFNLGYKPYGDTTADTSLAAMDALNVTHLRWAVHWAGVQTSTASDPVGPELRSPIGSLPPSSSVAQWDQQYLDLLAHGITPVIIVWNAPRWASTLYKCADPAYQVLHTSECPANWQQGNHFPHPDFYRHFQLFVQAIAERYPQSIIEGHNEPDYAWNSNYPNRVDATTAGTVQCKLFDAVRQVDQRPVLSMGLSDGSYERAFIARAKGCYTGFSFHPYPGETRFGDGSRLASLFSALRDARSAAGDTTPIWVTETGYSFIPRDTDPAYNSYWENVYADASSRLYNKLSTMPDVAAVMFHTLRDRPLVTNSTTSPEWHFGFNRTDWSPKPRMCTFLARTTNSWPGCSS